MPSSTQMRLTPKSCIRCREVSTSAALRPKRESLNTSTKETPSLPDSMSRSMRRNSGRPSMFLPDLPSSQYSPATSMFWNSAYLRSLSFCASRL